jgi:hypothetical protein
VGHDACDQNGSPVLFPEIGVGVPLEHAAETARAVAAGLCDGPSLFWGTLDLRPEAVPSPRPKYGDRGPDLTEIYLRF